MKLYIIRHGQSEDNVAMRQAGDSRLTSVGRLQAEATAEALRSTPIDHLYASPTRRTVETACIIGSRLGLSPVLRGDICERGHLFDDPGLTGSELQDLCANVQLGPEFLADRGWAADFPGETLDEMYNRAGSVVQSLRHDHPNGSESVALVTHAYFSGYLMSVALGFSREQVETNWLRMNNCGISHLEFKDHATMLWYMNAHAHIGELVTV